MLPSQKLLGIMSLDSWRVGVVWQTVDQLNIWQFWHHQSSVSDLMFTWHMLTSLIEWHMPLHMMHLTLPATEHCGGRSKLWKAQTSIAKVSLLAAVFETLTFHCLLSNHDWQDRQSIVHHLSKSNAGGWTSMWTDPNRPRAYSRQCAEGASSRTYATWECKSKSPRMTNFKWDKVQQWTLQSGINHPDSFAFHCYPVSQLHFNHQYYYPSQQFGNAKYVAKQSLFFWLLSCFFPE